jgi:alpha-L-fucosidase
MNYKQKAFPVGSAVLDHERSKEITIPDMVWQTCDCVYDGDNWSYVKDSPIKSPNTVIDELVDIVSKRGVLMLSFAPRPDGTFPDEQQQLMFDMGKWLKTNGEAIYSTRPWTVFGEGPSMVKKGKFTAQDIRFTRNKAKTILYAILLEWADSGDIVIKSINSKNTSKDEIKKISILGLKEKISWDLDENGLTIKQPSVKPTNDYSFPIKIEFKKAISGM